MPFLIDGHNVIAALEDIDLEDPDDEARLVIRLRAWAARERRQVIVVFDGGLPGGTSRTLSTPQVKVIFASRLHTNADRIIRSRLKRLRDPGNWTVVTSDREILDEARRVRARVMPAADFAARLAQPPAVRVKPESISAAEVDAWLEIFGEDGAVPSPSEPASPGTLSGLPRERPATVQRTAPRQQRFLRSHRGKSPASGSGRTIGEQVGFPVSPQQADPESPPEEKPSEVSPDEVSAWLQVFHDDPTTHIPPPKVRERRALPPVRKAPVVRKEGELAPGEVEAWLQIFGEEAAEGPGREERKGTASSRLARFKADLPDLGGEDEPLDSLSDEDLALWRRLFGDGE